MPTDIANLEGWLNKKKSDKKKFMSFGSDSTTRYFKVLGSTTDDSQGELTLAYYMHPKDKEAKGSIFLKDVAYIEDDGVIITLKSNSK